MKRKIAFNTHFICFLGVLVICIIFVVVFFLNSKDGNFFAPLLCSLVTAMMIFVVLTSPIIYIFEDDKLTIIYCIGIKESIAWEDIRSIRSCVGWFIGKDTETSRGLPVYDLDYRRKKKLCAFLKASIVNNSKTTALLKEYYKKKIQH